MSNPTDQWQEELVRCIHFLHQKGYAPATSSNYSVRLPGQDDILISASGIDKGAFSVSDLMRIDADGQPKAPDRKPSAETALHTMIYRMRPQTTCVLHTHSVCNTVLSGAYASAGSLKLEGFEVLKGLSGVRTHQTRVSVPIFANSQDIPTLATEIQAYWEQQPDMLGFLLERHGLYTWGNTIAEAKRHIEVFEFLFECIFKLESLSSTQNKWINGSTSYS